MFCSQCGGRLPENTKFCPNCGKENINFSKNFSGQGKENGKEIKNIKNILASNQTKKNIKKENNWVLFSVILLVVLLINSRFILPDLIKALDSFQAGDVSNITAVIGRIVGELLGSFFIVYILYFGIKKINFANKVAKKNFIYGLIVVILVIILGFYVSSVEIDNTDTPLNQTNIGNQNKITPIQNVNNGLYQDNIENTCKELGDKYINEKSSELVRDRDGKYYKQTFKNIIIDYSPKLNTCLVMCDVYNQNNIYFIRIYALSEEYNLCNLSGDDPTHEEAYAYFHYLITGEELRELGGYIQKIKSECNISF